MLDLIGKFIALDREIVYNLSMPKRTVKQDEPLTDVQAAYVKHRSSGKSRQQSALLAGAGDYDKAGRSIEESAKVKLALAREAAAYAAEGKVTRKEVIQILRDAVEMARIQADPMGMVAGAREMAKICGLNAPEVKKVEHELGGRTLAALENLPDSELLKIANGRVIDVTPTRSEESDVPGLSEEGT